MVFYNRTRRYGLWLRIVLLSVVLSFMFCVVFVAYDVWRRADQGWVALGLVKFVDSSKKVEDSRYSLVTAELAERPDAEELLADGLTEAERSNRKVWLIIGSNNCLPCRQQERFIRDHSAILEPRFVVVKIMIDSMENGTLVHERFRPESAVDVSPIPWSCILSVDGSPLVTADGPEGALALPQGGPQSRAWFLQMLRLADVGLTEQELIDLEQDMLVYHQQIWLP